MTKLADKWTKSSFSTWVYPDPIEVSGYVNGPFGIDDGRKRPGDYRTHGGDPWFLIHIPTGLSLGNFPTLALAQACAEKIAARHAWERITRKFRPSKMNRAARLKWYHTKDICRDVAEGKV